MINRLLGNKPEVRQVPPNRVEVDGVQHPACAKCGKAMVRGYDSPELTRPDQRYHPALCGPDFKAAYARVYPDAEVPDVPDGLLEIPQAPV